VNQTHKVEGTEYEVSIVRTDEGLVVDVYHPDHDEPVASTYALDVEVEMENK